MLLDMHKDKEEALQALLDLYANPVTATDRRKNWQVSVEYARQNADTFVKHPRTAPAFLHQYTNQPACFLGLFLAPHYREVVPSGLSPRMFIMHHTGLSFRTMFMCEVMYQVHGEAFTEQWGAMAFMKPVEDHKTHAFHVNQIVEEFLNDEFHCSFHDREREGMARAYGQWLDGERVIQEALVS